MRLEEKMLSGKDIRKVAARQIRRTRHREAWYRKAAESPSENQEWQQAYTRSAAACSASIDGVLLLVQGLGLKKERSL